MDSGEQPVIEAQGARIPALGLGTWSLRDRACARIVQQALALGYRHIDTAQIYENEREVGEGIRASGVRRADVFVTTKVWTTRFAPNDLERSVKDSLVRLRLTEVDLLLLHWPNPQVPLVETLGALAHARELGLARHIGVSNFTVALMDEAVANCPAPLACNQVEYHPLLSQAAVIAAARRLGLALVAYSPLAQGKLKGHPVLEHFAKEHGRTSAQIALRWILQQGIAAIPRTAKVERLSENFGVFDFTLDPAEMVAISALGSKEGRTNNFSFSPRWDD